MHGVRDDAFLQKANTYVVIEVTKCKNENRDRTPVDPNCDPAIETCETVDPLCAEDNEIVEWLSTKTMQIRGLNKKIDFSSYT